MANLRVGLIGCGGFMRYRLKQLLDVPGVEVAALCDISPKSLDRFRNLDSRMTCPAEFHSHAEMLAKTQPDAVVIASPHTPHIEHIVDSFAAGAHVLVEKPLSCTVADCRKAIEARDRSGKVGAVSYQRHGQSIFAFLKDTVASCKFGRLLMVNSSLAQDWLRATGGTWRQDLAISGGGQINDSGSHMIDILLWIIGVQGETVSAFMDNRGSEVDINSVVNIQFEGGALGSLTIIGDAPLWQERHSFWFEEGAIFVDDEKIKMVERSGRTSTISFDGRGQTPDANFVAAIRGEGEILAPFECGLRTIALTEAAWRSSEQGGATVQVQKV